MFAPISTLHWMPRDLVISWEISCGPFGVTRMPFVRLMAWAPGSTQSNSFSDFTHAYMCSCGTQNTSKSAPSTQVLKSGVATMLASSLLPGK